MYIILYYIIAGENALELSNLFPPTYDHDTRVIYILMFILIGWKDSRIHTICVSSLTNLFYFNASNRELNSAFFTFLLLKPVLLYLRSNFLHTYLILFVYAISEFLSWFSRILWSVLKSCANHCLAWKLPYLPL